MPTNYQKIFNIIRKNKIRWRSLNSDLNEGSGIYILTRTDEHGIKYAYVGQAKHVLTRLESHLRGYSHIDLSLKKHGLKSEKNPYGYDVEQKSYPEEVLDYWEKIWIKEYADKGYQLRNNTVGGQGKGKVGMGEGKTPKGYYDGVKHGYAKAWKEVAEYFEKYLDYTYQRPKCYKKNMKIKELFIKKFAEFMEKMNNAKKKD